MEIDREDLPKTLQKWWDHQFSSGGVAGPDYRSFQTSYGNWLKKALPAYSVTVRKNHYEFSAVITRRGEGGSPDRHVYMSISDVRYWPREWACKILVRTMAHARDWSGGANTFCTIPELPDAVDRLFRMQDAMNEWLDKQEDEK